MIGRLTGRLLEKQPTRVILDVQGVGYDVAIPVSTYQALSGAKEQVTLLTYLYVREDLLQLYGFRTAEEKELFLKLIAVSGVGPKVAIGILSSATPSEFRNSIVSNDIARLKALPGIGKKTAERLILELKDKLGGPSGDNAAMPSLTVQTSASEEAKLALLSLGYNRVAVEKIMGRLTGAQPDANVETLIREALQRL